MCRQHLVQLLYLHRLQLKVGENPYSHDLLGHLHYSQTERLHHRTDQSDHVHHIQLPKIHKAPGLYLTLNTSQKQNSLTTATSHRQFDPTPTQHP